MPQPEPTGWLHRSMAAVHGGADDTDRRLGLQQVLAIHRLGLSSQARCAPSCIRGASAATTLCRFTSGCRSGFRRSAATEKAEAARLDRRQRDRCAVAPGLSRVAPCEDPRVLGALAQKSHRAFKLSSRLGHLLLVFLQHACCGLIEALCRSCNFWRSPRRSPRCACPTFKISGGWVPAFQPSFIYPEKLLERCSAGRRRGAGQWRKEKVGVDFR